METNKKPDVLNTQLAVLKVEPGDRLVVTSDRPLASDVKDNLCSRLSAWAAGVPVVILDAGLKLGALRIAEVPAFWGPDQRLIENARTIPGFMGVYAMTPNGDVYCTRYSPPRPVSRHVTGPGYYEIRLQ